MKRTAALSRVFGTVVVAGLLLSGCSAASNDHASNGASSERIVPGTTADDAQLGGDGTTSADLTPQVITTGSLTITDEDPVATSEDAARIVTEAGGRVDSRDETPGTPDQAAQANLTVRIPADDFEAVLAKLKALGTVNNVSISAVDVTAQAADLDARTTALQASVDRLLALMANATTTADLLAAETSLSERQAELDGLTAQRDALADQVDFSSVFVTVVAPGTVSPGVPTDFWGGVVTGWNALVAAAGGFIVLVGVLLPWLLPLAIIALIVVLVVRSGRRRGAARSSTAQTQHPAPPVEPSPAVPAGPGATMDR
ncbi:MAG TPA: DUF4349 domain-containing protein [Plantibacter sp.]|uniref:DUF4349 domain-containing protein n=1 Tax=unclassified Plantibacter TaxID=2624265 RepID=UPI002BA94C05|nr:DUF4349 domain-containing protein [Plantibacter sp.]